MKDLKGVIFLLTMGVVIALSYNSFSPKGLVLMDKRGVQNNLAGLDSKQESLSKPNQAADPNAVSPDTVDADITDPEIRDLGIMEKIIQNKSRIIIDVRRKDIYDQGHMPAALSFPLVEFDENIGNILSIFDRSQPLLIYCSSLYCTDSHTFANYLINLKFTDVKVFSPGFRAWEEAGRKIEKNE